MAGIGSSPWAAGDAADADDQVLTLRGIAHQIRRSWWLVVTVGLIGLVAGAGFAVVVPASPSASSLVLLPASGTNAAGQPLQDPQTVEAIGESPGVLAAAAREAGISLPFRTLQRRLAISSLTADVLQITAQAPTSARAELFANAEARQLVRYLNNSALTAASLAVSLGQEVADLQHQVADLKAEIASDSAQELKDPAGSAQAASTLNLIGVLQTEENNALLQLDSVNSQIAQVRTTASSPASGAVILELATTASSSSHLRLVEYAALGGIAGLLIGSVIAVARARRDRRLRRRDDIARAAGAPVVASLALKRPGRLRDWLQLLDKWEPTLSDTARLSRVLEHLSIAQGPFDVVANGDGMHRSSTNGHKAEQPSWSLDTKLELAVIAFAGDGCAQAAAVEVAVFASSLGRVNLALEPGESGDGGLSKALDRRNANPDKQRANLVTEGRGPGQDPVGRALSVRLILVDPRAPLDLDAVGALGAIAVPTLLIVASGCATGDEIADATDTSTAQGLAVVGVVVVNPDRADATTGRPGRISAHQRVAPVVSAHA